MYDDVTTCIIFVSSQLILFVQTRDPYEWRGYMYAIGMFLLSLFVVVFFHNSFNISYTTGLRVRTAITAAIYRKVNFICCKVITLVSSHITRLIRSDV